MPSISPDALRITYPGGMGIMTTRKVNSIVAYIQTYPDVDLWVTDGFGNKFRVKTRDLYINSIQGPTDSMQALIERLKPRSDNTSD